MATDIIRPNSFISKSSSNIKDSDNAYTYYQVVDEVDINDSDYIYTMYHGQEVIMGLSSPSISSGVINSITLFTRCWHESASYIGYNNVGCYISGSKYMGSLIHTTLSPSLYSQTWTLNPSNGLSWLWSDLIELGFVIVLDGKFSFMQDTRTFCSQAYVGINYTSTVSTYFLRRIMKTKRIP
jgi:hypothetical protein